MKLVNIAHSSITMILALLVLGSCAPKSKKSETKLKLFSSFSANGLNMDGGALIYGRTVSGSHSFSRIFKGATEFAVDINYGLWNFSVITYAGGAELTGARECASLSNVLIQKDQNELDLTVSPAKCFNAGVRGLQIKPCTNANFTTVSSGGAFATCGGSGGDGGLLSYKLVLKPHDDSVILPANLTSPCIEAANFDAPPLFIPTGLTGASRVPTRIRAYSAGGCTGVEKVLDINTSAAAPALSTLFYARNVVTNLKLAVNLEGPGIDTTAPTITLSSNAYFDGINNWINGSNDSTFNVNGVCENGIPIIATFNGSAVAASPVTCSAGTYTFAVDLSGYPERSSGAHYNFVVSQTDVAGNTSAPNLLLYKDTIFPGHTITASPINVLNQASTFVSGTCDEVGATISGTVGGLAYPSAICNGTNWTSIPIDVTAVGDGAAVALIAGIIDRAGNTPATASLNVVKDTVNPIAPSTPQFNVGSTITNVATLNAAWTAGAGLTSQRIEFYGASGCTTPLTAQLTIAAGVIAQSFISPSEGTYSFKVIAIDGVGNESSSACSNNIVFDSTAPNAATGLSFSQTSPTVDNTLDLSWSAATDINGIQNYRIDYFSDAACTVSKDSFEDVGVSITHTTLPLTDGSTYYTVTSTDNASNNRVSNCSSAGVIIDTIAPAAPILNATNWVGATTITKKRAATNPWTYSDDADVLNIDVNLRRGTCAGDIVELRSTISKTLNTATFDFPTQGTYFYEVIARDAAGNTNSVCSTSMQVTQNAMSLGGNYFDGFVIGETHLYSLTETGLEVYDVSSAPTLTKTSTLRVKGFSPTRAAFNSGNDHIYLYNQNEMYIWRTNSGANLDTPEFVGKANIAMSGILDHAFSSTYMWLISANTIHGIDLTTPGSPTLANSNPVGGQTDCKTVEYSNASGGDFIYAACDSNIVAFDISTEAVPSAPVTNSYSGDMTDLLFDSSSGYLYATGPVGLTHVRRFDVTAGNQFAPLIVNALTGISGGNNFGNIRGTNISLCTKQIGVNASLVDITGAGVPTFFRKLNPGAGVACNRSVQNNTYLFALTNKGIHTVTSAGGVGPVADANPYLKLKEQVHLVINNAGTIGFSTNGSDKAHVYNLSDKENPILASSFSVGLYNTAIFDGVTNTVVAINGTDIDKIDLTVPTAPSDSGSFSHGSTPIEGISLAIDSVRRIVYMGQTDGQVSVFNLDTGATLQSNKPVCLDGAGDEVTSMLYKENTLFVTCKLTNMIYSLTASDPGTTFNVAGSSSLPASPTRGGIAHNNNGDALYIPMGSGGFQIVLFAANRVLTDVGNIAVAGTVNSVSVPTGSTTLLFLGKEAGIESYNVTNPTTPVLQGSSLGPGQNKFVVPVGPSSTPDYVYSAANTQGLQVYRVTDPATPHQ